MSRKTSNWVRALGDALSLATSFAAAVALGYFLGKFLDARLGTGPYLMLVMMLLGVAAGLKMMYEKAFGRGKPSPAVGEQEEEAREYRPSREAIEALRQAKELLKELEKEELGEKED